MKKLLSPAGRLLGLATLVAVAFCGLGFRLVELQVLRHDELRDLAQDNTRRTLTIEPRRGDIRDIKGNLLATSRFVKHVVADPALLGGHHELVGRTLAPLLQMPEADLVRKLAPVTRLDTNGVVVTNRWVSLKKKVPLETWRQVTASMARLNFGYDEKAERKLPHSQQQRFRAIRHKAIYAEQPDQQQREYPGGRLASHMLGYTGTAERKINNRTYTDYVGMDGIELALDAKLNGVRGWVQTEKTHGGQEIVTLRQQEVDPRNGYNIVLTIDSGLQHIVESELAEGIKRHSPDAAHVIMVRPRTGELLAMATLPDYNPNRPGDGPEGNRRNRIITDIMEPGSTFKAVTISAALNERLVTLADTFDCEQGKFFYAGHWLREHETHGYGVVSVQTIIAKSSNVGAAKIGIKLGDAGLHGYIRAFGFGDVTGIPLRGEQRGIVHPVRNWTPLSISRVPMGHEVAVTPLQMCMAFATIANGGRVMRPMLVDRFEDDRGHVVMKIQPQVIRQAIAPQTAKQMTDALKVAVSPEGTGLKARLEFYTVAGKTGTAQKAGPGGYMPGKYFSSFIGFFPADNPELCIAVIFDEPHTGGYYGGAVCAPVFKAIAERAANYLNIKPDLTPPTPMVVGGGQVRRATGAR
jgi:cell division protein FtsI/penicillin-binding protein 2